MLKTPSGELAINGAMGKLAWKRDGSFVKTSEELALVDLAAVNVSLVSTPTAAALREVRGQLSGDRYVDLRYPDPNTATPANETPPTPYMLARGSIGGALETRPFVGMPDCTDYRLAARDRTVVVACAHPLDASSATDVGVRLLRSTDAGDSFTPGVELVTPSFSDVYLAIGADGSTLVTNVCRTADERRPRKEDDADDTCKPKAPVYVHVVGGKPTTLQGSAPHLAYGAFSPLVASDGRLYFLGRRTKDDRAAVFVSSDGGRSFDDHTLDPPPPADVGTTDDQGATDVAPPTDFGFLEGSPPTIRISRSTRAARSACSRNPKRAMRG